MDGKDSCDRAASRAREEGRSESAVRGPPRTPPLRISGTRGECSRAQSDRMLRASAGEPRWAVGGGGRRRTHRAILPRGRRVASRVSGVLVGLLLTTGWTLYAVERFPAVRRAVADARMEVTRYLYKQFVEPRCDPPGLELGSESDLVRADGIAFKPCDEVPTYVSSEPRANESQSRASSRPERSPRVYIFEHMAALIEPRDPAPPQLCSERDFHRVLAANRTGLVVSEPERADLFYVPYYAGCLPRDELRREAKSGRLMREYVAALEALPQWRRYGGADFFSYSQRHLTERVAYGLPLRDLMREVPLTWLTPEVTLITGEEVRDADTAWRLARAVIVPQPPVLSRVVSLRRAAPAAPGVGGGEEGGGGGVGVGGSGEVRRPFRFALVGGIINAERRRLVRALEGRSDAFVRAACRDSRYAAIAMDLESIYASADFCIVPMGDTLSSRRTFDALRMGCVPVLTSPLMQLPFPDEIDYGDFVRFVDAGDGADIAAQLDALAASAIEGAADDDVAAPEMTWRRRAAAAAAEALAMEDCAYAGGMRLAVEAAFVRLAPLRAAFTAQPAVKGRGYDAAGLDQYKVEWRR